MKSPNRTCKCVLRAHRPGARQTGHGFWRQTQVRFGPVEQSPDQFKWFDGTEVQISRRHQDWFLARDVTGRQGWVHTDVLLTPKG